MMIAYKAFDPDLSCTSGGHRFQYEIDIWNQEPAAVQNGDFTVPKILWTVSLITLIGIRPYIIWF